MLIFLRNWILHSSRDSKNVNRNRTYVVKIAEGHLMSKFADSIKKLLEEASLYRDLLSTGTGEIRACIELVDTSEMATLILGEKARVVEGSADPDFKMSMSSQTFRDIIQGKADAFALAGRARPEEVRPIEFEVLNKQRDKEVWETVKALLTYVFCPGKIKIKSLSPELAGQAHGAHPIPLVYWNGLRYSWFIVKTGEILNKEGEKDPWPQLFIVLEGKGRAIIGNEEFEMKPKTAIYVPRNCVHQIIAAVDVELIWLAWQAG
jgi:mannose-6-phosphate isomerase-like protein (cupin superfamily)/putative sterol carrier protein